MKALNRNQPCPCGSGKRYKHCCGAINGAAPAAREPSLPTRLGELMKQALAAHGKGRLGEAEARYREAVALDPKNFDALHMLGVIHLQRGQAEEASRLFMAALPHQATEYPPFYQNLGLALAAVAKTRGLTIDVGQQEIAGNHRVFLRSSLLPPFPANPPIVSIVAPCYNHESYVADAIASIARQSYPNLELVIIDDGSRDGSVATIQAALAGFPFPHRFIHRENRGAHATLNEAVDLAAGDYIGILNTDDRYRTDRVELMVRSLLATGARWGFSNLYYLDGKGVRIRYGDQSRVDRLMQYHDGLYGRKTFSEDFLIHNTAVTTGNLFFEKSLWRELGGFADYRYNHDWAFCLAAILIAEPAYLDEPTYDYRLHGANTINESRQRAREEADRMLSRWHREQSRVAEIGNRTFAAVRRNRWQADLETMSQGAAHLLDRSILLEAAADLGFAPPGW